MRSASLTIEGNSICIVCQFSSPLSEGCFISVRGSDLVSRNLTLMKRSPTDTSVQGCIGGFTVGNYTVSVYDLERGQPVLDQPAVILPAVTITEMVQPSISQFNHCIKQ